MVEASVRFIQISDLHLGGTAWPGKFRLSDEQKKQRIQELRATVKKLGELIEKERPDVVLIPGDFFDNESVDPGLVNLVVDTFAKVSPCPVMITPGNHDPLSGASPYLQSRRETLGLPLWPENVYIFDTDDFSTAPLQGFDNVSITGHAFHANVHSQERPLSRKIERSSAEISILLLHGSRGDGAPPPDKKITLPFTKDELAQQGFSYTALGHYHAREEIRGSKGNLRAAYGGRPFTGETYPDESRQGACIVGTITPEGVSDARYVPLDKRGYTEIEINCKQVATSEELARLAREGFAERGSPNNDFILFKFTGTHTPGLRPELDADNEFGFVCKFDFSKLRPAHDIDALLQAADSPAASAESLFAKELTQQIEAAEDDEEKDILRDALDYGLNALKGMKVEPANAD